MAEARQEIVIEAPPSRVWSLVEDVRSWPTWNSKVTQGRMLQGDEFYPGATFQYVYDGKPLVGTVTEVQRLKTLAWRADNNTRQRLQMQADGERTKVSGAHEVSGFMASLRKGKSEQQAAEACQQWLGGLKRAAEESKG